MPPLPKLGYSLTRSFPWPWFGPAVYLAIMILVPVLLTLNVALVGFETQLAFSDSFTARDNVYWYTKLTPEQFRRKQLCDPHMFTTGDRFTTNSSLFEYTIQTIDKSNTNGSGIAYDGSTLQGCDIEKIMMTMDARDWTMDLSPIVVCSLNDTKNNTAVLHAKTDLQMSILPGKTSHMLGALRLAYANSSRKNNGGHGSTPSDSLDAENSDVKQDKRGSVIEVLVSSAHEDYFDKVMYDPRSQRPSILSLEVNSSSICGHVTDNCAFQPPEFDVTHELYMDASMNFTSFSTFAPPGPDNTRRSVMYDDVMVNVLRLLHASVEIDLGRLFPNNFLVNQSAVNDSINFSDDFLLSFYLNNPDQFKSDFGLNYPLPFNNSASVIQVEYACRLQFPKPPGSAAASVIAATVSMYSSGWAALMIISTFIIKRRDPGAMRCEEHTVTDEENNVAAGLSYNDEWKKEKLYAPVRSESPPPV